MDASTTSCAAWYRPSVTKYLCLILMAIALFFLSERYEWCEFSRHKGWTVLIALFFSSVALLALMVWFAIAKLFRGRVQFSLSALLVGISVVGIVCGWFGGELQRAREQQAAMEVMRKKEWPVSYTNWQGAVVYLQPSDHWLESRLIEALGYDFFLDVALIYIEDREQIDRLWCLPKLRYAVIQTDEFKDADLKKVIGSPRLERLVLRGTSVTDAAVRSELWRFKSLKWLVVDKATLSKEWTSHLRGFSNLSVLEVAELDLSEADRAELSKVIPNCKILIPGRVILLSDSRPGGKL